MNTLGIRVEPNQTSFAVIESKEGIHTIINIEHIKVPAAFGFPEKLKYIRNCILDIIREYSVSKAGIRVAEGNSRNINVERLHIEGVIQEAFSSSTVDSYFRGRKTSIAPRLKLTLKEYDEVLKGSKEMEGVKQWEILTNKISREAAMVALGAIEL